MKQGYSSYQISTDTVLIRENLRSIDIWNKPSTEILKQL